MDPHEYQRFPSFWPDSQLRKWNLWGYVDVRDVAAACRLGLEAAVTGSQNVIIAAADTVMNRPGGLGRGSRLARDGTGGAGVAYRARATSVPCRQGAPGLGSPDSEYPRWVSSRTLFMIT